MQTSDSSSAIADSPAFKNNNYPLPIALAFQNILEEKELVGKLTAVFTTYENVIVYLDGVILSLYYHGNYPINHHFFQKTAQLELPEFINWFRFLKEVLEEAPKGVSFLENLKAWYGKVEQSAPICLHEIVNYQRQKQNIGHLTNLYELRQAVLPTLAIMNQEEKENYLAQSWHSLEIVMKELSFLKQYPLSYVEKILPGNKEILVKRLMGTSPVVEQMPVKNGDTLCARQMFLSEEQSRQYFPLHPFLIYQECYYCLREKKSTSWELLMFQGRTLSRLTYKGNFHKVPSREHLSTYLQLRQQVQRQIPTSEKTKSIKDIWETCFRFTEQELAELRQEKIIQSYYPRKQTELILDSFIATTSHSMLLMTGIKGCGKTTVLGEMTKRWLNRGELVFFLRVFSDAGFNLENYISNILGEDKLCNNTKAILKDSEHKWIIVLDSVENISQPEVFFKYLANFVSLYPRVKIIISLGDVYYHIWSKYIPSELFMPVEGKFPVVESSRPYLRLTNLSPVEVKDAYYVIASDIEGSVPSFVSIPKKIRSMLRNPGMAKIFLWCLRNQEVPRHLCIRDVMEGYVMNYINFAKKRREFVEHLSILFTKVKNLPVTAETIIDSDDVLLLSESLDSNFSSGLLELTQQGIIARTKYFQEDDRSFAIYFPINILQDYIIYRSLAVEGKHRDDLLVTYLTEIANGNLALWGVVYFALSRLLDKQYCDRFVDIVKKAPPSPMLAQLICQILILREETDSHPLGTGGYLDTLLGNLLNIGSQDIFEAVFWLTVYLYEEEKFIQAASLLERLSQVNNMPAKFFYYDTNILSLLAAWSYQQGNDSKHAAKLYKKGTKNLKKLENSDKEAEVYALLERVYLNLEEFEKAEMCFKKAYGNRDQIRGTLREADYYGDIAKFAQIKQDRQKALDYLLKQREVLEHFGRNDRLANTFETIAKIMLQSDDREQAIAFMERASVLFHETGCYKKWVLSQQLLAKTLIDKGDLKKARFCLIQCLETIENLEDKEILAETYVSLGNIGSQLKKSEEALDYFKVALEILSELDNENGMAHCYEKFGVIYMEQSKDSQALEAFDKALKLYQKNDNQPGIGKVYSYFGNVYCSKRDFQKAQEYYRESFKVRQALQDRPGMAEIHNNIAEVLAKNKNFTNAVEELEKGKKIYHELKDARGIAQIMSTEALIYQLQGDNTKSLQCYEECSKMLQDMHEFSILGGIYNRIGLIYKQRGNLYEAQSHFEKSAKIQEEIGDMAGLAASYNNIGLIYDAKNDYQKALEYYTKDLEITEKLGDKRSCATSYTNIAMLHHNHGYYARALWFFEKSVAIYKELEDNSMVQTLEERIRQVKEKL